MTNPIIKISKSNKINSLKNLIQNTSILSFPSLCGIILSLIAIPIHLQINGKSDYGNYIFFHFAISFGLILNFGINKIVAIELSKKKYIKSIIKQSIKFSLILVLIIFLINLIIFYFLNNFYLLLILTGLGINVIYLSLEGILQGFKKFKFLSIANFIFYTLSINIPSILLLKNKNFDFNDLILFSLLIKIIPIFLILIYLREFYQQKINIKYNFLNKIKKYSKWYFLHLINVQIYDFIDKYLIKIFIGPTALAIYSIPYQIAGKITIFSKSISAVLLPEISYGKEINFRYSINIYTFLVPIILFLIFPILKDLLYLWLRDQYSLEILHLCKIFLIISWISGVSHILIAYFEGKKKIKYNSLLELYFIIPFLIIIFFILGISKNLIYISYVLLFKEFTLLVFRTIKIKEKLNNLFMIYSNLLLVILNLLISIYYDTYFYLSFFILISFNSVLLIKKFKK